MEEGDTAWYREVPLEKMDEVESYNIIKYLPERNRSLPKSGEYCTLDDYTKVDTRFYHQRARVLHFLEKFNMHGRFGYFLIKDLEIVETYLDKKVGKYDNS